MDSTARMNSLRLEGGGTARCGNCGQNQIMIRIVMRHDRQLMMRNASSLKRRNEGATLPRHRKYGRKRIMIMTVMAMRVMVLVFLRRPRMVENKIHW